MIFVDKLTQIRSKLHQILVDQLSNFFDKSALILNVNKIEIFGVFKEAKKRRAMVLVLDSHRSNMLLCIFLNRNQVLFPQFRVVLKVLNKVLIL